MQKFELWVGSSEQPNKLAECEAETFRSACLKSFSDNPLFNEKTLFWNGLHIYDNPEEAEQDYVYRNTIVKKEG